MYVQQVDLSHGNGSSPLGLMSFQVKVLKFNLHNIFVFPFSSSPPKLWKPTNEKKLFFKFFEYITKKFVNQKIFKCIQKTTIIYLQKCTYYRYVQLHMNQIAEVAHLLWLPFLSYTNKLFKDTVIFKPLYYKSNTFLSSSETSYH